MSRRLVEDVHSHDVVLDRRRLRGPRWCWWPLLTADGCQSPAQHVASGSRRTTWVPVLPQTNPQYIIIVHSYIIVHCWVCSLTSSAYAFWANKKCSSTKQLINCIIYFCHKYVKYTSKETFTENSFNRQTFQTPAGQKEQTQSLLICLHVARSLYSLSKAVLIFMHVRCRRDPHVASVSVVPHSPLSL